jgi:DHA1 family multidrug resistance protein-like MFS transporter
VQPADPAPYKLSVRPTPIRDGLGQVLADKAFCRLVLILSGYYALWVQVMLIFPILVKQMAGSTTAVGWMYTLETAISLALLYPLPGSASATSSWRTA